ncbi:MAG: Dockerin protein [Ignavibacteria bacterium]|nr:Dockerin protein [Ignavibacteria bacterium]
MNYRILVLFLVALSFFFHCNTLSSQDKQIKFFLNDNTFKAYNINDIDSINLIKSTNNYVMKIFYRDSLEAYYPTEVITKIQFNTDSINNQLLNVYVYGYPKGYKLFEVDSIYFYIDIYQPLTIGTQVWMLKNLDVYYYRNEDSIPEVRDSSQWSNLKTGACCFYNNNDSLGKIYGKLYNWYAVNHSRGLAPYGWHIATDDEWNILFNYLGGPGIAGGKMKETGISHWQSPNEGATNESGFTALPGGCRFNFGSYGSFFVSIGNGSHWWSSTEKSANLGRYWRLRSDGSHVNYSFEDKVNGFSVRCIKDNVSTIPIITIISPDSAAIGDTVTIYGTGFGSIQSTSFVSFNRVTANEYTSWNYTQIKVKVPKGAKSGKLSITVNGIMSNEVDFKIIKYFDTVKICTQVWMLKNLDVDHYRNGDSIPEVRDATKWAKLTTGAWCNYNNDLPKGEIYGKLYNWYAVNDPRGLAPAGWHVPSDGEWSTLTNFPGSSPGGKLKETGTAHWWSPNAGATNETGFTALPGGTLSNNTVYAIGSNGRWWTSTEFSASDAWYRDIPYDFPSVYRQIYVKTKGLSVRCVRDK